MMNEVENSFPPATARKVEPSFRSGMYVTVPSGYMHCYTIHSMVDGSESYRVGRRVDVEETIDAYIKYTFIRKIANAADPRFEQRLLYLVFEGPQDKLWVVRLTDKLMDANRGER